MARAIATRRPKGKRKTSRPSSRFDWVTLKRIGLASLWALALLMPPILLVAAGWGYAWPLTVAWLLIIATFLTVASDKHIVLFLLLVSTCASYFSKWHYHSTNLLIVIAGIALIVIVRSCIRQNLPIWRDFRASNRKLAPVLARSITNWLPLLALTLCIYALNSYINYTITKHTYSDTPIDEFCDVVGYKTRIACTELGNTLTPNEVTTLPASEALKAHIGNRFLSTRKDLLARLEPNSNDEPITEAMLDSIDFLRPSNILGIEPTFSSELQALITEREELLRNQRPARQSSGSLFGLGIEPAFTTIRNPRILELNREIAARIKSEQAKYGLSTHERYVATIKHLISSRADLPAGSTSSNEHPVRQDDEDPDARSARLRVAVIRDLAKKEDSSLAVVQSFMKARPNDTEDILDALSIRPLCSTITAPAASEEKPETPVAHPAFLDPANNSGSFPCLPIAQPEWEIPLRSTGLDESIELSLGRWQQEAERLTSLEITALSRRTMSTVEEARREAQEAAHVVPTGIDLGRQRCSIFHIANCLMNWIKERAEKAYGRARADLGDRYKLKVNQTAGGTGATVDEVIDAARTSMDEMVTETFSALRTSTRRAITVGRLLNIITTLTLLLVAIRSFLYVLALELFHADEAITISLESDGSTSGSYVVQDDIEIGDDFKGDLIGVEALTNQTPSRSLVPWALSAPIKRILMGKYFLLHRGGHEKEQTPMTLAASGGRQYVNWSMTRGEEVVFNYGNFFGASENVELRALLSLRLSTLLLGRLVFHYARCNGDSGRLILSFDSRIEDDEVISAPPHRVLAWNRHAEFKISNWRDMKAALIDGFNIVPQAGPNRALLVVGGSSPNRRITGAIRYVRRLLAPFF